MKINVIGPGAMGIVLSYYLHEKNDVILTVKGEDKEFYKGGLTLVRNGETKNFSVAISDKIEEADITIVTVKSYDLLPVYHDPRLRGNVILIQNGLEHLDIERKGVNKIYAVTTWGARRLSKGVTELTGTGYFRLGGEGVNLDLKFLRESGINAEWTTNIVEELYRKAAINAVINPITSIFGVLNGSIVTESPLWEIASIAIAELDRLFTKMGYRLDIEKNVAETCRVTAENVSSMLQDLQTGRMTEIDSITGKILELGEKFKVEMIANRILYDSVKYLESRSKIHGRTNTSRSPGT
jgi:2-dehydropantoate 2-reductase